MMAGMMGKEKHLSFCKEDYFCWKIQQNFHYRPRLTIPMHSHSKKMLRNTHSDQSLTLTKSHTERLIKNPRETEEAAGVRAIHTLPLVERHWSHVKLSFSLPETTGANPELVASTLRFMGAQPPSPAARPAAPPLSLPTPN